MFIVAVIVRKGGAGKSTVAFSVACDATDNGYRVLLVSADPQGDSARWAKGLDGRVRPDERFESREHGFTVLYSARIPSPDELAEFDLVVVDLPPTAEAVAWVRPNMWLVPIDGRNALEDTMPILRAMTSQGGKLVFVPNKCDAAGLGIEATLLTGLKGVTQRFPGSVLLDPIPDSMAVARVGEYAQPPWKVPYGVRTKGAEAVVAICEYVRTTAGRPKARAKKKAAPTPAARWR